MGITGGKAAFLPKGRKSQKIHNQSKLSRGRRLSGAEEGMLRNQLSIVVV